MREFETVHDIEKFVKYDANKLRFDLVDPKFEREHVEVLTHGAAKYTPENWKQAEPAEARARYYAALRRHLNAWYGGEVLDPDSGYPHLAHACCCIQFLRWFEREGKLGAVPGRDPRSPDRDLEGLG